MKKLFAVLILALTLSLVSIGTVTASAELGPKDKVYGDNYIVTENPNPITNDKLAEPNNKVVEDVKGIPLLVVSIAVATLYVGFTAFRVIRKVRKNEK